MSEQVPTRCNMNHAWSSWYVVVYPRGASSPVEYFFLFAGNQRKEHFLKSLFVNREDNSGM